MTNDVDALALQLSTCDPRALMAVACAAAERVLPFYDQFGSGDPRALRNPVDGFWQWVESGTAPPDTRDTRATLDEYADIHYEEGDNLMGGVVASVLRCIATYEARDVPDTQALEAARALTVHADTASAIAVLLEGSPIASRVEQEEESWRDRIVALARNPPARITKQAFTLDAPQWMPELLRAST